MLKLLLLSAIILVFCMAFLAISILLKKNGRFPNTHVSGNKAMRDRGITCVQSQDFAARHRSKGVNEIVR
ncbi:MAG: hypothetical protein Q4E32_10345 [Bacteroidales bacterium]|nr:hypothetical protein [Bacteroidales bacterium]